MWYSCGTLQKFSSYHGRLQFNGAPRLINWTPFDSISFSSSGMIHQLKPSQRLKPLQHLKPLQPSQRLKPLQRLKPREPINSMKTL